MKITKEQKGITLISLIITIVVLLILAGVAIGTLEKNNIIGYAKNAANLFEDRQKEEEELLREYEEQLKGDGENLKEPADEYVVYGPKSDGTWIIKTSKNMILISAQTITTHDYKGYTVEEAINLMDESERETARDTANQLIEKYGEINQVIIATQMDNEWGDNWEIIINGFKPFVFGIIVDNNDKLLVADPHSDEIKIKEEITLNNDLPEDLEKIVSKSSETYNVYVIEDVPVLEGINDADYVIVMDWEKETMGVHFYSEEMGGSMGSFGAFSIQQNDTTINVTLNEENKIIDSTFYKVTDSNENVFYVDKNKEKLYVRLTDDFQIGVVEDGESVLEIEKNNYNIRNVGYIFTN